MNRKRTLQLAVIMMFWFTISFMTNILGPLIPDIIRNFNLTDLALAGFIPTSFFIAYAIMSVPSGILIEHVGEKPVLFCGFLLPFIGTAVFVAVHTYPALLASSFIIGIGMAMLQTVLNPLQRVVAGEENYAFIAELAQFTFGVASFISPLVYSWLIHRLGSGVYVEGKNAFIDMMAAITPPEVPWVSLYWIFLALLLVMMLVSVFMRFPEIQLAEDELSGSRSSYAELFRNPFVWLFFWGIFCYVGTEQSVSVYMSRFLEQYHGIDPHGTGAAAVGWFWGSMTIGALVGMVLLRLVDSRQLLKISGVLTIILLVASLFGPADISLYTFPAVGFSISMMYSIIFSLALNSVSHNHGSFAGILCSAIVGGAVGPLAVSLIADASDLRTGMCLIFVFVISITAIGFVARPLVTNKTVSLPELFHRKH